MPQGQAAAGPTPLTSGAGARVRGLALLGAVLVTWAASAPARAGTVLVVPAGGGGRLVVSSAPFRLALEDPAGRETVGTVAGVQGPPVRVPGLDGPQPVEPVGAAGAFPALGWVVGAAPGVANPAPPFTGNRLFGAEAGAVVSVVGVGAVRAGAGGAAHADLVTDDPSLGPGSLDARALPGGGVRVDVHPPAGLPGIVSTVTTLSSPVGEGLYGLGTRRDAFDQRGLLRNVWVEEQYLGWDFTQPATSADPTGTTGPAYTFPNGPQAAFLAAPELSGSRGWTAWTSQTELGRLDLASATPDRVRWAVAADHLSLSLAGGGLERSVAAYTADSGRAPAPPSYVFAPWLDRINENGEGEAAPNGGGFTGGAAVKADVAEFVRRIAADALPIRTFGIEGWHAVPGGADFFASLRRQGYRLVAYWNPFLAPGKPVTGEAVARGVVVRDATGAPYQIVTNRQNTSYVIDFSAPGAQAFWDEQIARSCDLGFEGTHADFGEFVIDGMVFADGTPPAVMHNRYPVLYARATRAALSRCAARHPGFEPFFYVRAGYGPTGTEGATTGFTPGVIVGDETTDWAKGSGIASVVPAMLNLAMGGGTAYISDVGGYLDLYAPPTTAELFVRWSQLSALTAVMRIHDDTYHGSVYPWSFGAAVEGIYRRYARLHALLAGLSQRYARAAAATGAIGPVRPLVLGDPTPGARSVSDEWTLGRDLLAAPVIAPGAASRPVYLPAGASWRRASVDGSGHLVLGGPLLAGGRSVSAPVDVQDIPLYVRDGETELDGVLASGSSRGVGARRGARRARLRLTRRCIGAGRLRVVLAASGVRVASVSFLLGRRRVARAGHAPFLRVLTRRVLARTRARRLRAVVTVRGGRRVVLVRSLPRCGLPAP